MLDFIQTLWSLFLSCLFLCGFFALSVFLSPERQRYDGKIVEDPREMVMRKYFSIF